MNSQTNWKDKWERIKNRAGPILALILLIAVLFSIPFLYHACDDIPPNIPTPNVRINGHRYNIDDGFFDTLPDGYIRIGEIKRSSDTRFKDPQDWDSNGCDVGDIVYQRPDSDEDVYVRSTLFGGETYHYLQFSKHELFSSE